ncbi:MAG TPA: thiamine phosphate synthase [Longimicrobiales bacterium]|nr:thiamine phosphate synthase [Longimicrobiales bacterium]
MSAPAAGHEGPARFAGALPRLHVVSDDAMLARGGWEALAADVLAAGGAGLCLHLRGPRTDGATLHRLARELLPHARRTGALLFVNDRVDVALGVDVDGVHLGGRSLPVGAARGLLGDDLWLGVSCRDAAQIAASHHEGADYAFLGTIFPTPTHPEVAGMGLEGLAATLGGLGAFPVIGIGGVDPASVPGVLGAGAHGVAVSRGVWDARDSAAAVRRYVEAIETGATEQGGIGL